MNVVSCRVVSYGVVTFHVISCDFFVVTSQVVLLLISMFISFFPLSMSHLCCSPSLQGLTAEKFASLLLPVTEFFNQLTGAKVQRGKIKDIIPENRRDGVKKEKKER